MISAALEDQEAKAARGDMLYPEVNIPTAASSMSVLTSGISIIPCLR